MRSWPDSSAEFATGTPSIEAATDNIAAPLRLCRDRLFPLSEYPRGAPGMVQRGMSCDHGAMARAPHSDDDRGTGGLRAIWPAVRTPVEPPMSQWVMPTSGPSDDSDMVAVGADLQPGTLLSAYRNGLFPIPVRRRRIGWFSPDPRGIIPLDGLVISRSLRRSMRRYEVRFDTCFTEVVRRCGDPSRPSGWIDDGIIEAYTTLHTLGWAHSVEVFDDDDHLVGGLYGVRVNGLFAGESMFHSATDASKVALVHLVEWLRHTDATLLDVQWTTDHLRSLGAVDIARSRYLTLLADAVGSGR